MQVLALTQTAAELGNINAISDAASATNLAVAAVKSAGLNVKINLKSLQNPGEVISQVEDINRYLDEVNVIEQKIKTILNERAGIS